MNIPAPSSGGGNPPKIDDGLYVANFNGVFSKVHTDWATPKDKFGKVDDGTRFHLNATILDDDREPVLLADVKEDVEDPDETLDLEALTRNTSSREKSDFYAHMKGILTAQEFDLWLAAKDEESIALWAKASEAVANRQVNVQVSHNSKGWPQIEAFLGPAKAKKAAK